jgi:hypothetical protein
MASMFNLVSSFGSKRDEYGVGDLLAEVSKRSSSISAEDRQEIANMTKRLRQHKPNNNGGSNTTTPTQTPDNSQHDVKQNHQQKFGKDVLKVDNLFRGFGSPVMISPNKSKPAPVSPPASPDSTERIANSRDDHATSGGGVLLRGFGHAEVSSSEDSSGEDVDSRGGYGQAQNL